eukprot:CAMPEP_0114372628 /NCGR_PEP_ID=MMETSP0101-20121206/34306_1 /TAXON_ID=38822 ORGANISM="Pteridomonas danica, Strain PT" /NCGR_SAMPLE_ID=MMETSP0101 /ASSEMBLY_ACC=CAM_ASM_000211 /LENGTH=437 /DNA_ID=CAMNT_0001525559 /DNA_START=98 /DNA_END=1411 /DNA_ORIENTATION=-
MAVNRFGILNGKKAALIKKEKREIAKLLNDEKEEKARIKVEHIIRSDFTIEAYEILELLCELLHERMKLLVAEAECPPDLDEAVCTLIYCANRTECPELTEITKQLKLKYGKEFAERASENRGGCVNERVVHKLSVQPPTAYLIQQYLMKIAEEHEIPWVPTDQGVSEEQLMSSAAPAPRGFSVPVAPGSGISDPYYQQSDLERSSHEASFPPAPSNAPKIPQNKPAATIDPNTANDFSAGFKAGFAAAKNDAAGGGGGGGVPVARVVGALPDNNVVTVEAEVETISDEDMFSVPPTEGPTSTEQPTTRIGQPHLPDLPEASPQPLKIDPALEDTVSSDTIARRVSEAEEMPLPPSTAPVRRGTGEGGAAEGGGLSLPEAPPSSRDSTGMSISDMEARLNGLAKPVAPPPSDENDDQGQPPASDYDSLMNRFNSLKN